LKKLKEAGVVIDPNYKETQREKWNAEKKEREKQMQKRLREEASSTYGQYGSGGGERDGSGRPAKKSATNEIHSSWEAAKIRKEKEKEVMKLPFQGKKKVFGEDGEAHEAPPPSIPPSSLPSSNYTSTSSSSSSSYSKPHSKDSATIKKPQSFAPAPAPAVSGGDMEVHPSWAAKQAQAAKLAGGFQGKKIKFNNDDD
jgi:hypothetical protein